MTITALGLRTVIYPAPDLEATKAWFAALLGATPTYDSPYYVGFDVGGYELGLRPDAPAAVRHSAWPSPATPAPATAAHRRRRSYRNQFGARGATARIEAGQALFAGR